MATMTVTGEDAGDDAEVDRLAKGFVLQPNTAKHIIWDMVGLLFVICDFVMIPFPRVVEGHRVSTAFFYRENS